MEEIFGCIATISGGPDWTIATWTSSEELGLRYLGRATININD